MLSHIQRCIPELDAAVTTRRHQLVLVDLRPRHIVEAILCLEAAKCKRKSEIQSSGLHYINHGGGTAQRTTSPPATAVVALLVPLPAHVQVCSVARSRRDRTAFNQNQVSAFVSVPVLCMSNSHLRDLSSTYIGGRGNRKPIGKEWRPCDIVPR